MHVVAKTGVAEIGERQTIHGRSLIVNRIPLKDGDRVIGAYGRVVFKTVEQLRELASKMNLLESKVKYYEEELTHLRGARYTFASIVGAGAAITAAKEEAERASRTDSTVLLRGETGTGKELFAHAIHAAGSRRAGPFIKLNCAAVPAELLESELFGYEEGAFTGARRGGKPGKFELAAGGTLFLDEIGDMPLPMQAKLLRVLQEKEVDRVGGTGSRRVDLRLIAATGRNLEEMVGQGTFRADLYYRVNVIPVRIPPLREHPEDLEAIAEAFLARLSADTGEPNPASFRRDPRSSPRVSLARERPGAAERTRAGGGDVAPRGPAAGAFPRPPAAVRARRSEGGGPRGGRSRRGRRMGEDSRVARLREGRSGAIRHPVGPRGGRGEQDEGGGASPDPSRQAAREDKAVRDHRTSREKKVTYKVHITIKVHFL